MKHTDPTADCGVIIGRFQVDELHDGHRVLLDTVVERHRKVIVLLGVSPLANSINNPLDFEARKQMLMAEYPHLTVLYVKDVNNDDLWSQQVDATISDVLTPNQTALLYGSRDSFIKHYSGRFDTYELPAGHTLTGTEIRAEIGRAARSSADWRAGVIWASRCRYPTAYQTVDVAIFSPDYTQILLGQKRGESGWRLIGGFSDPRSTSLEDDARRETMEEAGVKLDTVSYIGSFEIDDWRYRNEPDCIKTALFIGTTTDDKPRAGDDIERVAWFDLEEIDPHAGPMWKIEPIHRKIVDAAYRRAAHLKRTNKETK